MSMKRVQQGFTLIELMIVVAIIGILAAVAIPQYKNYTIKAKLGNALTAVDSVKTAVALCVQETGNTTGCTGGTNGIPADTTAAATNEVSAIVTKDGGITATLQNIDKTDIDGKTITWAAAPGANALGWTITTSVTNDTFKSMIIKNSTAAAGT
ncbi:pilin [Paucibacter sp. R3-3]|uniref:Pilin n=1 Tax=Roseateles agri TaxID=3098619 RepID=A0ABU5DDY0_9BURK|nr:pilin [Paucibacter sp. R3-3]MDY0744500.1 pilin [Paucibacter sp. R3-3]